MKLVDALRLAREPRSGSAYRLTLACGFTPAHLETFLRAHLAQRIADRRIVVETGLFGDVIGTMAAASQDVEAVVLVLEWADLDARLGYRALAEWNAAALADIPTTVARQLARLRAQVERLQSATTVVLSLPTLPFPLCAHAPPAESSACELRVRALVATFAADAVQHARVVIVQRDQLDAASASAERLDLTAEIHSGFPYSTPHAAALAAQLAAAVTPATKKKALITDLDDTLWKGIVGDDGAGALSWTHEGHGHLHGLYQRVVQSLAESGVLIGVASRNDPAAAEQGLARQDLLLDRTHLFPVEIHWGAKSESVARILARWNIHADSVVFVDDSLMELAEVKARFPDIECIRFPRDDAREMISFIARLRELFGTRTVRAEDQLRSASIRRAAELPDATLLRESDAEAFLQEAAPEIAFRIGPEGADGRAFDLVNKTNQFNLNGRRVTAGEWRQYIHRADAVIMQVDYEDKFGKLGTVAVAAGILDDAVLIIDHWVMSCRAFARRIEHCTLRELFDRFDVRTIQLRHEATDRNGPFRAFLSHYVDGADHDVVRIDRSSFEERCPPLYHQQIAS